MTSAEYSEKLKDPRWQKKRLAIFQRDNWKCQKCEDSTSTLNIHHRRYIPDREPWDYPDEALVTLCEDCHEDEKVSLNDICDNLISMVQDKFYSDDIYVLADAFRILDLKDLRASNIADTIRWILSSPEILKEMESRYLDVWYKETHKD